MKVKHASVFLTEMIIAAFHLNMGMKVVSLALKIHSPPRTISAQYYFQSRCVSIVTLLPSPILGKEDWELEQAK